jgi:hypothetical protein
VISSVFLTSESLINIFSNCWATGIQLKAKSASELSVDTYQQISEHLAAVLEKNGLFPASVDPHNPGSATFIQRMGSLYKISSLEEIGIGKEKRFEGEFMTLGDAIRAYVRRVANPDHIRVDQQQA